MLVPGHVLAGESPRESGDGARVSDIDEAVVNLVFLGADAVRAGHRRLH